MSSPDVAAIIHVVVTWRLNVAQCPLLPPIHSVPISHSGGTWVNRKAGEAEDVQKVRCCPFGNTKREAASHKKADPWLWLSAVLWGMHSSLPGIAVARFYGFFRMIFAVLDQLMRATAVSLPNKKLRLQESIMAVQDPKHR